MTIEKVTGILEQVAPKRSKRGYAYFDCLRIRTDDGGHREFRKVGTGGAVTTEALKGGPGAWYLSTADGAYGLFGVRRSDGTAQYAHWSNLEPIVLAVGALATIGFVARFAFGVDIPLLAVLLGPLLLAAGLYLDNRRRATRRAFMADTLMADGGQS